MKSALLSITWQDGLKGLITAIGTAILTGVYQLIQSNGAFDWATLKPVVLAGAAAGIAYLLKNFFSNSAGVFGQSEAKAPDTIAKTMTIVADKAKDNTTDSNG